MEQSLYKNNNFSHFVAWWWWFNCKAQTSSILFLASWKLKISNNIVQAIRRRIRDYWSCFSDFFIDNYQLQTTRNIINEWKKISQFRYLFVVSCDSHLHARPCSLLLRLPDKPVLSSGCRWLSKISKSF